uniref:Putative secreted peptide n=1 Tax=Anopheles braziliensis TaxID=58242 RepID=A0A2M3ZMQ8_9DIPT
MQIVGVVYEGWYLFVLVATSVTHAACHATVRPISLVILIPAVLKLRNRNTLTPARAIVSALLLLYAAPEVHLYVAPELQEQYAVDEAYRHSSH